MAAIERCRERDMGGQRDDQRGRGAEIVRWAASKRVRDQEMSSEQQDQRS
jgi:hypothetical protein